MDCVFLDFDLVDRNTMSERSSFIEKHEIEELCQYMLRCKRIVVFTGAGMSAESGIPTFRDAETGIWKYCFGLGLSLFGTPLGWSGESASHPLVVFIDVFSHSDARMCLEDLYCLL